MSQPFEPGDICAWQNLGDEDACCNGQECVVLSGMLYDEIEDRWTGESHMALHYEVRDEEGEWCAMPWEITRKRPPSADLDVERHVLAHGEKPS